MTIIKCSLDAIHQHLLSPKCITWYIFLSKFYGKCHPYEILSNMSYFYRTGPLIATWCMRMEGKNSYFKRAAQTSNFKNVAYSVAKRHQRLLCGYLISGKFFDQEMQIGPGLDHFITNSSFVFHFLQQITQNICVQKILMLLK